MNSSAPGSLRHYELISRAIEYMDEHHHEQPSLGRLASEVHLSEFHFQRLFTEWAGISPKRYLQYLTLESAKKRLRERDSLGAVAYDIGLSGQSRLHDLFVQLEGMTPGEYRREGRSMRIRFGIHDTPFGEALIALTERGVCHLAFTDGDEAEARAILESRWGLSDLVESPDDAARALDQIFREGSGKDRKPLSVLVKGTNFQMQVWQALLRIPFGDVTSYSGAADLVGKPRAARSVATAIAENHIAYLIPCHRVIRQSGEFSRYRWGRLRKSMMIAWEAAKSEAR